MKDVPETGQEMPLERSVIGATDTDGIGEKPSRGIVDVEGNLIRTIINKLKLKCVRPVWMTRNKESKEDKKMFLTPKENRKQLYQILVEYGYKHLRDGTLDEEGHTQKEIFENPVGRVTLFYEHDHLVYVEAK